MIRSAASLAAGLALLALASTARADDKAACAEGLVQLKDRAAKLDPVPPKLAKALRVAEREQGEREFDECLDALEDARRALPR